MSLNAYQTLRNGLAAAAALLLLVQNSAPAYHHHWTRKAKRSHASPNNHQTVSQTTSKTQPAKKEATTYGRAKSTVDVKSGGKTVASLKNKDRFTIIERDGDNYNVKLSDGKTGTVPVSKVSIEETRKPLPLSDTWSVKGNLVRMAYTYRGARYRPGGTTSSGFDCSGFVKFLYSHEGVKLPHSSRAQYSCGSPVSKGDLRPGDMVFFSGTYRRGISHVGMYIGEGKFIHASTERGGVRVDTLDAPYYRGRYAGARRP